MTKDYKQFETERLLLRPTNLDDANFVYTLMNSPKWIKYIEDRDIHSIDDAKVYIKNKMFPLLERSGYSNYTMITKEGQNKIGSCGLYDREGIDGVDIGFAILPNYEGQGFGYEAASKVLESARDVFSLKKISGITIPSNIPSQKLLEKIGLSHTKNLDWNGEEIMLYELIF